MKTNKLLDTEFKIMVIRILKEHSENFNSIKNNMETIKKNQSKMKNTLTEIKTKLQGINNRVQEAEEQISDFKDKEAENTYIRTAKIKENPLEVVNPQYNIQMVYCRIVY